MLESTEICTDDGISLKRNVCKMSTTVMAVIFLFKLSFKTYLNAPGIVRGIFGFWSSAL